MACGGASSHGCDSLLRGTFRNTAKSNDTKVAGANDSNPQQQTPVKKTYSTFPRKAENIDKNAINHVGGSDDETLLSTVYYRGKTLVFFKSESDDRDIKESGLYIAVFSNFALEKR